MTNNDARASRCRPPGKVKKHAPSWTGSQLLEQQSSLQRQSQGQLACWPKLSPRAALHAAAATSPTPGRYPSSGHGVMAAKRLHGRRSRRSIGRYQPKRGGDVPQKWRPGLVIRFLTENRHRDDGKRLISPSPWKSRILYEFIQRIVRMRTKTATKP